MNPRFLSLSLLFFLFLGLTQVHAQRKHVISAYNYNKEGELRKASEAIDKAIEHEKTKDDAKTWYYRGNIYFNIAASKEPEHQNIHGNPASVAIESYLKARKLDEKEKYKEDIDKRLKTSKTLTLNEGVRLYNSKDFKSALARFQEAIKVGNTLGTSTDTIAFYNGALAASQIGKEDVAIEYYKKCVELNYRGVDTYSLLINLLNKQGEYKEAFKWTRKGRKVYPNNKNLILNELNYYLRTQKMEKAMKNLELAIEKDKKNPILYFSLGTVYDNLYSDSDSTPDKIGGRDTMLFNKAVKNYKKAIELDSNYYDPIYNLGALYFNKGVEVVEQANTIKDQAKYKEELTQANRDFQKAKPYLEKARELKPDDQQTLLSLKQLYAQLDMQEKYEEVKRKLTK